ncbi:MAG TPA: VCBS repeat-containing protein, partial [Geobacteraceae bacterium]|nr:VCBS repeat-containing protein [Geobacteraceae bacterium]
EILAVDSQADADILIEGSYIVFGSVFSLDGLIKTRAGVFIDRVFIQGDSQSELIPAVTEMAQALQRALGKWDPSLVGKASGEKTVSATEKAPDAKTKKVLSPEPKRSPKPAAKPATVAAVALAAVVPKQQKTVEKPWESHRLPETLNGIAIGRAMGEKGVEIFITGERYVRYYLKGNTLQFVTAVVVAVDEKIVGVDVADLDRDGVPEVYVSIVKGGLPASQVYVPENNQLKKIAGDLPYLLRGIVFGGNEQKVYAQKMTAAGVLTGDVFELVKSGDRFAAENPLKLPLFGNLYNFNRFSGSNGKQNIVVGHPDGYLLVYSPDGKQLWKSRDKFGGSEPIACQPGGEPATTTAGCTLTRSQRLLVTRSGDIIVARNTGLNGNGNKGNYTKNNVLLLSWDGHSLQEKLRTGLSQNYLADFSFDERTREILLLEVEPKEDASGERGSRVVVRTIE